jgi:hypothetical protein
MYIERGKKSTLMKEDIRTTLAKQLLNTAVQYHSLPDSDRKPYKGDFIIGKKQYSIEIKVNSNE